MLQIVGTSRDRGAGDEQLVHYQTRAKGNTDNNTTAFPPDSRLEGAFRWNHLGIHVDTNGNNTNTTYNTAKSTMLPNKCITATTPGSNMLLQLASGNSTTIVEGREQGTITINNHDNGHQSLVTNNSIAML
jgi:hypothetical protein